MVSETIGIGEQPEAEDGPRRDPEAVNLRSTLVEILSRNVVMLNFCLRSASLNSKMVMVNGHFLIA